MTVCMDCAKNIPEGARKCVHCSSFQDFRRHLAFGNVFLSLIIALLSVVTVTVVHVWDALVSEASNVQIIFLDISRNSADILVTNDGDADGVVMSAIIVTKGRELNVPILYQDIAAPHVIKPRTTYKMSLDVRTVRANIVAISDELGDGANKTCTLYVRTLNIPSSKEIFNFSFPCARIQS